MAMAPQGGWAPADKVEPREVNVSGGTAASGAGERIEVADPSVWAPNNVIPVRQGR